MNKNPLNPQILRKLKELEHKYSLTGQDLISNLEGLQHANYQKYWEYIHLETLLSLQTTRTDFPDEKIFITYHQITELLFKLVLWEIEQICDHPQLTGKIFWEKMKRVNRYFQNLTFSFDIMTEGMDFDQFRQFRMALLPASGFQSAQFRMIEICSTDFIHLLNKDSLQELSNQESIEEMFELIYWKQGATDEKTGKETITSLHFQEKYKSAFIDLGNQYKEKNLWQCYQKLPKDDFIEEIQKVLRQFDILINVDWRLAHYKSAIRYLKAGNISIEATGGTNWQKYLPPRFQKTIFYPSLWSDEEKEKWGKNWVEKQI